MFDVLHVNRFCPFYFRLDVAIISDRAALQMIDYFMLELHTACCGTTVLRRLFQYISVIMSLASNNTVIERFTYDWLIRFAELHPFKFPDKDFFTNMQFTPTVLSSNYSSVSPLFTKLINQYMPYVRYVEMLNIHDGVIQECDLPSVNKYKIYICTHCCFHSLTPGEFTAFKNNRVMFYGKLLTIEDSLANRNGITPDELRYMTKYRNFDISVKLLADFAQPTKFSEICSLIKHCRNITLNCPNLTFDENMLYVLRGNQFCPRTYNIDAPIISDRAVLEMIEYFMDSPEVHDVSLILLREKIEALRSGLIDKYGNSAKYIIMLSARDNNSICVSTSWKNKIYLEIN
uniref:F-box domain-containing protein n=1 Tax=Panagrellus redivivus TaxID=6233 RepID=A0A7E5A0L6_PANRE